MVEKQIFDKSHVAPAKNGSTFQFTAITGLVWVR
jgi:hypothetical protein